MHPVLTHVPPSVSPSTMPTVAPIPAAWIAAATPAPPVPITRRSKPALPSTAALPFPSERVDGDRKGCSRANDGVPLAPLPGVARTSAPAPVLTAAADVTALSTSARYPARSTACTRSAAATGCDSSTVPRPAR